MPRAVRKIACSIGALVVILLCTQMVWAQGATVLMFYGGTLKAPVLLTGADAAAFNRVTSPGSVTAAEMGDRAYIQVALFWGSRSDPANNRTPIADLKPEMAWQHGRFYPEVAGKPAVLLTTPFTKQAQAVPLPSKGGEFVWGGPVSAEALAVLKRLNIIR